MQKNYWGEPTVSPRDLLSVEHFRAHFQAGANLIFTKFGLSSEESLELIQKIWNLADISRDEPFETVLRTLVADRFDSNLIRSLLDERAMLVASQIKPFVSGRSLLDIGAGDGMVSYFLKDHFQSIQLIDVVNYIDPRVAMPLIEYDDGGSMPAGSADTAILINVMHHSGFPVDLLRDSWAHTISRLIVIESVYGDSAKLGESELPFSLSVREQFLYTSFFDWFYNRVLHSDVPVPFNYLPPAGWTQLFEKMGMSVTASQDLGIDVEIVPIHHYLFVMDR